MRYPRKVAEVRRCILSLEPNTVVRNFKIFKNFCCRSYSVKSDIGNE